MREAQEFLNEWVNDVSHESVKGENMEYSEREVVEMLEDYKVKFSISGVVNSALKEGDILEVSGYYFDWIVKVGYSDVLKKTGTYAIAQGGLIHSDLEDSLILSVNGNKL
mgnify:CR=1 FL=1